MACCVAGARWYTYVIIYEGRMREERHLPTSWLSDALRADETAGEDPIASPDGTSIPRAGAKEAEELRPRSTHIRQCSARGGSDQRWDRGIEDGVWAGRTYKVATCV